MKSIRRIALLLCAGAIAALVILWAQGVPMADVPGHVRSGDRNAQVEPRLLSANGDSRSGEVSEREIPRGLVPARKQDADWAIVIDARDASPLADFPLMVAGDEIPTGVDGRIELPKCGSIRLPESAESSWLLAKQATRGENRRLYVLPCVAIDVTVVFEGFKDEEAAVTPTDLAVALPWCMITDPHPPRVPDTGLDWGVLREIGMDHVRLIRAEPSDRGVAHVRVRVPALEGFVIEARSPGWLLGTTVLGLPEEGGSCTVTLQRAPMVRGRLVDESGAPLARITMQARFFMAGHQDKLPLREAFAEAASQGGISCGFHRITGEGGFTISRTVTTDEAGRFQLPAPLAGAGLYLSALVTGRRATAWTHNRIYESIDNVELRAVASDPAVPRARLEADGRPRATVRVEFTDVTNPNAQSTHAVWTDKEGTLSTEWLIKDRAYVVNDGPYPRGGRIQGVLVWDGRAVIRGRDLPPYPEWIERRSKDQ